MSTVYIASSNEITALLAKSSLEAHGHKVGSTWHDQPFKPSCDLTEEDLKLRADTSSEEIVNSDALLLLVPPDLVPGGIYINAGIAIGLAMPVLCVGARPDGQRGNAMLHSSLVYQYETVPTAIQDVDRLVEEHEDLLDDDEMKYLDDLQDDDDEDDDDDMFSDDDDEDDDDLDEDEDIEF